MNNDLSILAAVGLLAAVAFRNKDAAAPVEPDPVVPGQNFSAEDPAVLEARRRELEARYQAPRGPDAPVAMHGSASMEDPAVLDARRRQLHPNVVAYTPPVQLERGLYRIVSPSPDPSPVPFSPVGVSDSGTRWMGNPRIPALNGTGRVIGYRFGIPIVDQGAGTDLSNVILLDGTRL